MLVCETLVHIFLIWPTATAAKVVTPFDRRNAAKRAASRKGGSNEVTKLYIGNIDFDTRAGDLADAFGKDTEALLRHWNEHGRLEGRDPFCTAGAMRRRSLRDQAVLGANSVYVCSTAKGAREAVRRKGRARS